MNYSITRAGRTTHLKIVAVALVAAIAVVGVGIHARTDTVAIIQNSAGGAIVKAGQSTVYAAEEGSSIR
jgi:hypothetical protein